MTLKCDSIEFIYKINRKEGMKAIMIFCSNIWIMIMPSSYLDNKILALFMPIEDYINRLLRPRSSRAIRTITQKTYASMMQKSEPM